MAALERALLMNAQDSSCHEGGKLVVALTQALLSFSYSGELCQQLLQAGVLAVLTAMLQAPGMDCNSKMLPAVSVDSDARGSFLKSWV